MFTKNSHINKNLLYFLMLMADDSSSDDFEFSIEKIDSSTGDLRHILQNIKYYAVKSWIDSFRDHLVAVRSDDVVLGIAGLLPYDTASKCLDQKIVGKADAAVAENGGDSASYDLLCHGRVYNTPPNLILELYRSMKPSRKLIMVSRVHQLGKTEWEEACRNFPEFNKQQLRAAPYHGEEILLLKYASPAFVEANNAKYNIFVISPEDFKKYLNDFEKELASD